MTLSDLEKYRANCEPLECIDRQLGKKKVLISTQGSAGLPRLTTAEYHADCVGKALGRGFTESIKAEDAGLKRKAAERNAMREAKTNE